MSRSQQRGQPRQPVPGTPSAAGDVDSEDPGGYETLTFGSILAPPPPPPAPAVEQAAPPPAPGPTPQLSPQTSLASSPETSIGSGEIAVQPPQMYFWAPGLPSPAPSIGPQYPTGPNGVERFAPGVGELASYDGNPSPFRGRMPPSHPAHGYAKQAAAEDLDVPGATHRCQPLPLPPREGHQIGPQPPAFLTTLPDGSLQYVVFAYQPQQFAADGPWITHPPSAQPGDQPSQQHNFASYGPLPSSPRLVPHTQQHSQLHSFSSTPVQPGPGPSFQLYPQVLDMQHAYRTAPSSPSKSHLQQQPDPHQQSSLVVAESSMGGGGWYSQPLLDHPRRLSDGGASGQTWSSVPNAPSGRGGRGRGRGRGRGSVRGGDGGRTVSNGLLTDGKTTASPGVPPLAPWSTATMGPHTPVYGVGFANNGPSAPPVGLQTALHPQQQISQRQTAKPAAPGWNQSGKRRGSSGPSKTTTRGCGGQANAQPASAGSVPVPWSMPQPEVFYGGPSSIGPAAWGAHSSSAPPTSHLQLGPPIVLEPRAVGPHPLPRKPSVDFPRPVPPHEVAAGQQQQFLY